MSTDKAYQEAERTFLENKLAQDTAEIDLAALNLASLAHLCRRATDRFFRQEPYDDRYCMELFRRAVEDQHEGAWAALIEQYSNLVIYWINQHSAFPSTDEDHDYFLNRTFDNFWRAFSRDPGKFSRFRNLKAIMQYLKLCVFTTVQEYAERRMGPHLALYSNKPIEAVATTYSPIETLNERLLANAVLDYVMSAVKTEQERIVAVDFLVYDMKPREIFAEHGDAFDNVSQVRRVKGNLMARLRRDERLLAVLEGFE